MVQYRGTLRAQNPKHLSCWICRLYSEYGPPDCVVATSKDGLPGAGLVAGNDVLPHSKSASFSVRFGTFPTQKNGRQGQKKSAGRVRFFAKEISDRGP